MVGHELLGFRNACTPFVIGNRRGRIREWFQRDNRGGNRVPPAAATLCGD
jgi:hypothetical protein